MLNKPNPSYTQIKSKTPDKNLSCNLQQDCGMYFPPNQQVSLRWFLKIVTYLNGTNKVLLKVFIIIKHTEKPEKWYLAQEKIYSDC